MVGVFAIRPIEGPFFPIVANGFTGEMVGEITGGKPREVCEQLPVSGGRIERAFNFDPVDGEARSGVSVLYWGAVTLFAECLEEGKRESFEVDLFAPRELGLGFNDGFGFRRRVLKLEDVFQFFVLKTVGTDFSDEYRD